MLPAITHQQQNGEYHPIPLENIKHIQTPLLKYGPTAAYVVSKKKLRQDFLGLLNERGRYFMQACVGAAAS